MSLLMFRECGFNSGSFYGCRHKYKNALCCSVLQLLNCRCSHRELVQSVSDVFVITNGLKPFGSRSPGIMPHMVQGTRHRKTLLAFIRCLLASSQVVGHTEELQLMQRAGFRSPRGRWKMHIIKTALDNIFNCP